MWTKHGDRNNDQLYQKEGYEDVFKLREKDETTRIT